MDSVLRAREDRTSSPSCKKMRKRKTRILHRKRQQRRDIKKKQASESWKKIYISKRRLLLQYRWKKISSLLFFLIFFSRIERYIKNFTYTENEESALYGVKNCNNRVIDFFFQHFIFNFQSFYAVHYENCRHRSCCYHNYSFYIFREIKVMRW